MKTSTHYVRKYRERKKRCKLLLPHLEIEQTIADELVEAGFLGEWDTENPKAVGAAILKLALTCLRTEAVLQLLVEVLPKSD